MDVNPLYGTAGLPRIVKDTIHNVRDCQIQIGIRPNVGRVLTAQLQPRFNELTAS